MRKIFSIVLLIFLAGSIVFAKDTIFQHPANISNVQMPEYKNVSCKFTQTKSIPNSNAYIKSGGNFKFDVKSGVIFDTLYPVKSTTAYTTEQSKRVSDIIVAISRKDYSYINKNFDVFYVKNPNSWQVALKPKKSSKISNVMNSIVIDGSTYINRLEINTLKSGSTKINFTECK